MRTKSSSFSTLRSLARFWGRSSLWRRVASSPACWVAAMLKLCMSDSCLAGASRSTLLILGVLRGDKIFYPSFCISIPTPVRFILSATLQVVPEPEKGSSTTSPSLVKSRMNHSGKVSGKAAECPLFRVSVAR